MSAPASLPFGKWKGVPLAQVPADYLEFMAGKPDLYPRTRAMLEEELKRRGQAPGPYPPEPDEHDPDPDGDSVPPALRDVETTCVAARCPHCGKRVTVTLSLEATR